METFSVLKRWLVAERQPPGETIRLSRRQEYAKRKAHRADWLCYSGLGVGSIGLAVVLGVVLSYRTPEQEAMNRLTESARQRAQTEVRATPAAIPASEPRRRITFVELGGFEFTLTKQLLEGKCAADSAAPVIIPETVRALHGHAVTLEGFMVPLLVEGGLTREWLLVRDRALCCYGKMPRMNEWVHVRSARPVKPVLDGIVRCGGRFSVGEAREGGLLTGIYQLEVDEVRELKE